MAKGTSLVTVQSRMKSRLSSFLTVCAFVGLFAYAVVGPSGLIALSDHRAALHERQAELRDLDEQHAALENRVKLLDPDNIDADLGGELIRRELGVAAPDEIVIPLD